MKRNKFNLSHYRLLSCDLGELVPCGVVEVLPGDSIQQATSVLLRAAPMLSPPMHPVHARVHHWFVPHRLVWDSFDDFITGGPDGLNASTFPTKNGSYAAGTLGDYLGMPGGATFVASAIPFRAYALIWNEWYRDQDLETALTVSTANGNDTTTNVTLQNCDWEKDYFTTARPWEQKGPVVTLPLGTVAPIKSKGTIAQWGTDTSGAADTMNLAAAAASSPTRNSVGVLGGLTHGPAGVVQAMETDLSTASAVTVNRLRQALAIQRYEEARARYGSRYVEYLRYLGVRSSDARLQRPEYLGGASATIQFSEVLQTGPGTDPVGDLKGHGIAALRSNRYRRFFEEHGYIMTLLSVRPKTIYMNGIPKTYTKTLKEDFWQKELEHIGQMPILNKEVYAPHASPDGTFGYQDRYDDYRRLFSQVNGEFRSASLNFWHFARSFGSTPALNASFVKCVPTEVPFAVPSEDVIYAMVRHNIQARRLVSRSGTSYTS